MTRSASPEPGRIAALDMGKARVGLAISDELGRLAHAREPLDGRNGRALLAALRELARAERITRFVVGLPLHLSGTAGVAAARAARFAQKLADATGVEVELVDERWSTVQAERELRAAGLRGERIAEHVDSVAAALILQQWLDQHAAR